MDRAHIYRFQAIKNAHPSVVALNGSIEQGDEVALNKNNNSVVLDESKIAPEMARLKAEYENDYSRKRKAEYDQMGNQFEMMFDDKRDGTTTWVDKINEIKAKYPKG